MSYKVVHFSSSIQGRQFATSTIKQRVREKKKNMRIQFRQLIKDYKNLYAQGKDLEEVDKLFQADLVMILQEALQILKDGGTLNQILGIASLVPETRKTCMKVQILIKKVNKFLKQNGYLNKTLQQQYTSALKDLIEAVTTKVKGNQINSEELEKSDEELAQESEEMTQVNSTASKAKIYILNFSAEDLDEVMDSEDIEEVDFEDIQSDKVVLNADCLPKVFSGVKSYKRRFKSFNSDQVAVTLRGPRDDNRSDDDLALEYLDKAITEGKLTAAPTEFNMDVLKEGDEVEFKIYMPASMVMTSDPIVFNGDQGVNPVSAILAHETLTVSDLIELEDLLMDHPEWRDIEGIPESIKFIFHG